MPPSYRAISRASTEKGSLHRISTYIHDSSRHKQRLTVTSSSRQVFFFSTAIFQRAGLSRSEGALASLGCGFANAALALLVGPIVSRVSLRRLLTASCLGCAACLAAFAAALCLMVSAGGGCMGKGSGAGKGVESGRDAFREDKCFSSKKGSVS